MMYDLISSLNANANDGGMEAAIRLAECKFEGRLDLDGNPAVLHALEVGRMGSAPDEQIVGYLHDVVEDTDTTLEDLERMGFTRNVIEAVGLLTHEKGVPYEEYLEKIISSNNRTAIQVKKNDLNHNLLRGKRTLELALQKDDNALCAEITCINAKHEKALEMILRRSGQR